MSEDEVELLGADGDFAGYNLFTYCGNNPVVRADNAGALWHIVGGALIGAAAGVLTKAITNAFYDQKITDGLFTAGLAGAVSGGLAASGVGLLGQIAGNAAIGVANNVTEQVVGIVTETKIDAFNYGSMLFDGAVGAVAGFVGGSGAGSKNLMSIGKQP